MINNADKIQKVRVNSDKSVMAIEFCTETGNQLMHNKKWKDSPNKGIWKEYTLSDNEKIIGIYGSTTGDKFIHNFGFVLAKIE